jgi:hypothetical protein
MAIPAGECFFPFFLKGFVDLKLFLNNDEFNNQQFTIQLYGGRS